MLFMCKSFIATAIEDILNLVHIFLSVVSVWHNVSGVIFSVSVILVIIVKIFLLFTCDRMTYPTSSFCFCNFSSFRYLLSYIWVKVSLGICRFEFVKCT